MHTPIVPHLHPSCVNHHTQPGALYSERTGDQAAIQNYIGALFCTWLSGGGMHTIALLLLIGLVLHLLMGWMD